MHYLLSHLITLYPYHKRIIQKFLQSLKYNLIIFKQRKKTVKLSWLRSSHCLIHDKIIFLCLDPQLYVLFELAYDNHSFVFVASQH